MPTSVPWALVPARNLLPTQASLAVERAATLADDQRQVAFLWTTAIADEAISRPDIREQSARPIPDFFWMAAGFVPVPPRMEVPLGVKTQDGFFFGLCLFPSGTPAQPPEFLPSLMIGSIKFPVLRLPSAYTRHVPAGGPPDPIGAHGAVTGTTACWAQPIVNGPNPTGLPGTGILTAAHVAVTAAAITPMTPSSPYAVVGYAIDAAVLYPERLPPTAAPLAVNPAAAVGSDVDVFPAAGGSTTATILMTFQPTIYVGFLCPHRMIIDTSFVAGDSGSLVKDHTSHDATGLYIGEILPVGGTAMGACQIMQQVATELGIELYL